MAKGRRARRILALLLKVSLAFLAISVLSVITLRFIAPPFSALMVERRIGSWFGESKYSSRYEWVSLDKIAPVMSAAVIASEDQKFSDHYGFDIDAIQRAMGHNERSPRTKGASTLTQQTAKNMFLWSSRSWLRKGVEAYFTVLLETFWGKIAGLGNERVYCRGELLEVRFLQGGLRLDVKDRALWVEMMLNHRVGARIWLLKPVQVWSPYFAPGRAFGAVAPVCTNFPPAE